MANDIDNAVSAMEPQTASLGFLDSLGEAAQVSMAISLKRIADSLGEGSPFLAALFGTLDDASHNHQQRMQNI